MAKGSSAQVDKVDTVARERLLVKGVVQGVGFRPFIYRIAREEALTGFVRNTSKGVEIELEGTRGQLKRFSERMHGELPALAEIDSVDASELPITGQDSQFQIVTSHTQVKGDVRIPTDIKVCEDCQREILDQADRHYYYPLTNCTNCGPRFTVIKDVPYDRQMTTMEPFKMCSACEVEYMEPLDRRFHAQPTACPDCGPKTKLITQAGETLAVASASTELRALFAQARKLLLEGKIIAVKGLGGFHFVCNANDSEAVRKLRARKKRPYKPLAVMARNEQLIKDRCRVSAIEEQILISTQAPIVILDKKDTADFSLVAPGINTVGVMLPYAPIHLLLFATDELDWLVMTSANPSNMPITIDNEEALTELNSYVDYFLLHDREIEQRCDDSLVRIILKKPVMIRRSRGYTPERIKLPINSDKTILAVGGEMKNIFAYMKKDQVILSQYIGEIDSWEGRQNFIRNVGHFERLFDLEPDIVAYDKHPSYQVTEVAKLLPYDSKVEIQHHHAHMASCMAEHGLTGTTLGVILDGTGYGDDQTLWGSELLLGDYKQFTRIAHGKLLPVVGGEKAIEEPWRMAVSLLHLSKGEQGLRLASEIWPDRHKEIDLLGQMLEKQIQIVYSSGMGRLFDGISALLGICDISTYEGEAAIRLASYAERFKVNSTYTVKLTEETTEATKIIDWLAMIDEIITDKLNKVSPELIAYKFHMTIAKIMVDLIIDITKNYSLKQVVLSGGTWHNELLLTEVVNAVNEAGLKIYFHEQVPTNDSGIALGQAMIAAAKIDKIRSTS
ncbi:carbamoyltransferase HypF [Desulfuribacillus alkaliarsenatis]|uniref:Carbamoyltransferase n=1 Tax=Desulfuribacillus alkaliarsenatis TaxID=766136 RepID=A0A1E5FYY4_9FIRM|nr:carbamoyltransferase HypF [Desulfuribacillus alkaliarsenatis]OEF95784.1 carbamoyltransferase HypF [Desulfuribacillus alkaliarsenatis]